MATKQQDKAAAKAAQIKAQNAAKEVAESEEKTQTVQPTGDENAEQTIQKAEAENTNTDATTNDDNGSVHSDEAADPPADDSKTNLDAKNEEASNEEAEKTADDSTPTEQGSGENESPYVKFKDEVYSKLTLTGEEPEEVITSLNQYIAGHYSINSSIENAAEEAKLFLAANAKPVENDFETWFKDLLLLAHEKGENLANRDHYKHYFDNGIGVKEAFKTEYPYHL